MKALAWTSAILTAVLVAVLIGAVPTVGRKIEDKVAGDPALKLWGVNYQSPSLKLATPHRLTTEQEAELKRYPNVDLREFAQTLKSQGGAYVGELEFKIGLENRRNERIDITDVQVVELNRTLPIGGTVIYSPSQGSTEIQPIYYDLDAGHVTPRKPPKPGSTTPGGPYFADKHLSIDKKGDRGDITVWATTDEYTAEFEIRIDYAIAGSSSSLIVRDVDQQPFRITADYCKSKRPKAGYQRAWITGIGGSTTGGDITLVTDPDKIC